MSVFEYTKEILNFGKGRIIIVIEEVIEYSSDTEELRCGFPLLNEQFKVVGMYTNKLDKGIGVACFEKIGRLNS